MLAPLLSHYPTENSLRPLTSACHMCHLRQALNIVKREVPFHRWEPIYIGTKAEPFYDERLSWEGKQDKMAQVR